MTRQFSPITLGERLQTTNAAGFVLTETTHQPNHDLPFGLVALRCRLGARRNLRPKTCEIFNGGDDAVGAGERVGWPRGAQVGGIVTPIPRGAVRYHLVDVLLHVRVRHPEWREYPVDDEAAEGNA